MLCTNGGFFFSFPALCNYIWQRGLNMSYWNWYPSVLSNKAYDKTISNICCIFIDKHITKKRTSDEEYLFYPTPAFRYISISIKCFDAKLKDTGVHENTDDVFIYKNILCQVFSTYMMVIWWVKKTPKIML